jgi:serine/threonine-protein kinase
MAREAARPIVLVVDDAEDIHDIVDARLSPEFDVRHAFRGAEGIRMARAEPPDVLLLDLDLAGQSGLDVLRLLLVERGLSELQVIFLTGTSDVSVKIEALESGAVDYVTKPFDADELRARVRGAARRGRHLKRPRSDRDAVTMVGIPTDLEDRRLLLGRYKLDVQLGMGGTSRVFRAIDEADGRAVAIKMLRIEHTQNAEVVGRFRRELVVAKALRDPNVIEVFDHGFDAHGTPFIVEELLEGEDLGKRLARRGRIGLAESLEMFLPAVDAMARAHARGVVHRDLKPENLFLERHATGAHGEQDVEVIKILDFGISKMSWALDETPLTGTGVGMGTPAYMSPEQIRSPRAVDARSDVWSLGVILFQLLAGRRPFEGESPWDLMMRVTQEDPPALLPLAPALPASVAEIVSRCLRRDPAARFADAAALAAALRAAVA